MRHSFRLKIGLLSVLLSGGLLLAFGVFASSVLDRVGLDRIDRELLALTDGQVRKSQPPGHWERFDDSLRSIYGEDIAKQFVVKTTLVDGDELYASGEWPSGLPLDSLPLSLDGVPAEAPGGPPKEDDWRARGRREGRQRPYEESSRRPPPRRLRVRGPVYATLGGQEGEWRAMSIGNEEVTLSIAMDLAGLHAETRRFRRAFLIATPVGLLLLAAGGWLIGHVALRPVNVIARTAEAVTSRRLDERIANRNVDQEFQRLTDVINGMLERLERGFQQATRFSADAAHELKTPVAILQAQVERCLQRAADGSDEQREYAEQLDELQRLKSILRKLLLLSQADAGKLPLALESVNLAERVRAAVDDVAMLAPDRKTRVDAPAEVFVQADPDLLNQVIGNLVSNAIKFGDAGSLISVELATRGGQACLTVENAGSSIREQDRERIFERFYRVDESRSRDVEGAGLGLSLAREIARAHGGELTLERSDETGTTFALRFPLAPMNTSAQA